MSEHEDFGQVVAAAFIGSMVGATLFVATGTLFFLPSAAGGKIGSMLGAALLVLPIGWVIAAVTAWPIGSLIGWVLSLTGPTNAARAASGGGLTGFILIATVVVLGSDFPSDAGAEEWFYIGGFTLLGAVSGLLSYRLVLRPKPAKG